MGIEQLLPNLSSFLPGKLGINCADMLIDRHRQLNIIKKEDEMSKEELLKVQKEKTSYYFMYEFMRDSTTMALLYFGGKELGLIWYAVVTYIFDRHAYLGGGGM